MNEQPPRVRRTWMAWIGIAVGAIGLCALAYVVVRAEGEGGPGFIVGSVIGAFLIPFAITLAARALYVKFIDGDSEFWSAPWFLLGTFVLALFLVPGALSVSREQDAERIEEDLAEAERTCEEQGLEIFPDLGPRFTYDALPPRAEEQATAQVPPELEGAYETARVSGPGIFAVVIAAPIGESAVAREDAIDGFERSAEEQGFSTSTEILEGGTDLVYVEVDGVVTGVAVGDCHFRSFTSRSLPELTRVVESVDAAEG